MPDAPLIEFTAVDVCNAALDQIGQPAISALDGSDKSKAAIACQKIFPQQLAFLLRDYPWNFGIAYVNLPAIPPADIIKLLSGFGTGGFGSGGFGSGVTSSGTVPIDVTLANWPYWYMLPNNLVKAWVINEDPRYHYRIVRHALLAKVTPVMLEYEMYVDDPNIWDASFRDCFSIGMAARLCRRLLGNLKLAQSLDQQFLFQLTQAKATDGSEQGAPFAFIQDDLIKDRE